MFEKKKDNLSSDEKLGTDVFRPSKGSAKVVISPSWSCSFAAIFLRILLIIFPDLVLGSPSVKWIKCTKNIISPKIKKLFLI